MYYVELNQVSHPVKLSPNTIGGGAKLHNTRKMANLYREFLLSKKVMPPGTEWIFKSVSWEQFLEGKVLFLLTPQIEARSLDVVKMEYFCEGSMDCNGSYDLLVKSPSEYLCINKQRQIVAAFGLDKVEMAALVAEH